MSMTDAINIVRMYLFGTSQPSTDDFNKHITREGASTSPSPAYQFSAAAYMTTGAGRYALPSLAPVVKAFFEATSLPDNPVGEPYKYAELLPRLGLTSSTTANVISVPQYGTDILSQDYPERAFIFGSTVFHLDTTKILFHVESGKRWIENLQVIPDKDNWDFTAGSPSAQYINLALGPSLDPYGIGKKVDLVYTGDAPIVTNFTEAMYAKSKSKESVIGKNEADKLAGIALLLAGRGEAYLNELTRDPFLSYRHNGKNVIYGSNGADLFTSDSWAPSWGNAVASTGDIYVGANESDVIIGGEFGDMLLGGDGHDDLAGEQGNDTLIGAEGNDILEGGKDNDQLYGDAGSDTYVFNGDFGNDVIVDSDGSGQIEVDGQVLSAQNAKKVSANTYKDKATGWIFFTGDVLTDGTATLVITKDGTRNSSITVRNWRSAQLGITLNENMDVETPSGLKTLFGDQVINQSDVFNASFDSPIRGSSPPFYTAYKILALNETDALGGGMSSDWLDGGEGDDLITGGAGQDTLLGGLGNDAIFSSYVQLTVQRDTAAFQIDPGYVVVMYGKNNWLIQKKEGSATWFTNWIEQSDFVIDKNGDLIDGGVGNDTILGSNFSDSIDGGGNDDTIAGWGGSDLISGGDGADSISGDTRNQVAFREGLHK